MIGRRGEEKVGVSAWDLNEGVVHEGECVCVCGSEHNYQSTCTGSSFHLCLCLGLGLCC